MAVDGVNGQYTKYVKDAPKEFSSTLDKDAFLKILVTQFKYQNPLEPTQDTEFIGQMAQFSALEQAQNTNRTIEVNSANNMVNKLVKARYKADDSTESKEYIGLVEKVMIKDDIVYLTLNVDGKSYDVKFNDVKEVTELENSVEQIYLMNQNMKSLSAFNLIGKTIKGKYLQEETVNDVKRKKAVDIEGVVEKVKRDGTNVILTVKGKDVYLEDVSEVK